MNRRRDRSRSPRPGLGKNDDASIEERLQAIAQQSENLRAQVVQTQCNLAALQSQVQVSCPVQVAIIDNIYKQIEHEQYTRTESIRKVTAEINRVYMNQLNLICTLHEKSLISTEQYLSLLRQIPAYIGLDAAPHPKPIGM